ncbi:18759_t:CDS:2, partial [Racocetra persica]
DLSEYITESIKNLEPGTRLFLIAQVEITDISISDNQSFKMIANMIAHNIKEGDAIGFTTPLLNAKNNQSVTEVYCDVTYKTAKERFELYGLIGNFENSGYPLAYLILDTT